MGETPEQHKFGHIVHATATRAIGTFVLHGEGVAWRESNTKSTFKLGKDKIRTATWSQSGRWCLLHLTTTASYERFDGFRPKDQELFADYFNKNFGGLNLGSESMLTRGLNVGQLDFDNKRSSLFLKFDEKKTMEIALNRISQCVAPNKNEIEFQFNEDESGPRQDEVLVEMRMYIPPNQDGEDESPIWQDNIVKRAGITGALGNAIVDLDESIGNFLTPRGKYRVEMHKEFMRMKGKTYDYTIPYTSFAQMFILPKNDEVHSYFVVSLSDPIRQGKQRYRHLVMQVENKHEEIAVNLEPDQFNELYQGKLKPLLSGPTPDLLGRIFHLLPNKKVFRTGDYRSSRGYCAVKCSLKTSDGYLYPMRRSFFFVHKPATYIRHEDIDSIEFLRYSGGSGSARSFDLEITCRAMDGENPVVHVFSQIDKSEYAGLFQCLSTKKINIRNIKAAAAIADGTAETDRRGEGGFAAMDLEGGDEESEDSDFGSDDGQHSDSSEDSDVSIVDIAQENAEEAGSSSTKKRKRKKPSTSDSVSTKRSPTKAKKLKKDPKAPKRGQSAYNFFFTEKRKELGADRDLSNKDIMVKLGEMWKSISPEEKEKYEELSSKDKERYEEEMKDYVPSEEYQQAVKSAKKSKAKGKKKKKKSDPNAPKKGKSSYMLFCAAKRKELAENQPDLAPTEVMKALGELWRNASDDEKKPFEDAAEADKERYMNEMKDYKPPEVKESSSESESSSSSSDGSGSDSDSDNSGSDSE